MMFWGLSVPAKERTDVVPYDDNFDYVHVSQASLGPDAKDGERVFVQARQLVSDDYFDEEAVEEEGDQEKPEIVLGVLCKGKVDHMHLDLVFDRPFELFHTGSGSVHFSGYKTSDPDVQDMDDNDEFDFDEDEEDMDDEDDDEDDDDDDEGDEVVPQLTNASASSGAMVAAKGKKGGGLVSANNKGAPVPASKAARAAAATAARMQQAQDEDEDDEDDEDFDEDDLDDDDDDLDGALGNDDDMADIDDEDEDEDDEGPTEQPVVKPGAKRPAASPATPSSGKQPQQKKAKPETPATAPKAKPGSATKGTPKVVTPASSKQGQPAASAGKAKTPTPGKSPAAATPGKSPASAGKASPAGAFMCVPCNKKFGSEQALGAHTKSKHNA